MSGKPPDPATRRKNIILGLFLAFLIVVLVLLAVNHVSPDIAKGHDSLFAR